MSGQQNTGNAPLRPLARKHMAAPRERSVLVSAVWDHKGSRTPRAQMRSHTKGKTSGFSPRQAAEAGGLGDLSTCRRVCVTLSSTGEGGGASVGANKIGRKWREEKINKRAEGQLALRAMRGGGWRTPVQVGDPSGATECLRGLTATP